MLKPLSVITHSAHIHVHYALSVPPTIATCSYFAKRYVALLQGQLLEGFECNIYLYCFTFDDINLNRAFVIIVLFPKKYSKKQVCANDIGKLNAL